METNNTIVNNANIVLSNKELQEKGKGRHFISRFIEAGIAEYKESFGKILITKETLDTFVQTLVGCPVIIKHKDITQDNVDKERVGVVSEVWYNQNDGWFYCSGIIYDLQAIDLIENKGWSVSCTYNFTTDNKKGTYHGLDYDMQFTGGEFLHLAIVDNPRYEEANIVMNEKVDNEDKWIIIKPNGEENKGRHLLLKDGESPKEAIDRIYKKDKKEKEEIPFEEAPEELSIPETDRHKQAVKKRDSLVKKISHFKARQKSATTQDAKEMFQRHIDGLKTQLDTAETEVARAHKAMLKDYKKDKKEKEVTKKDDEPVLIKKGEYDFQWAEKKYKEHKNEFIQKLLGNKPANNEIEKENLVMTVLNDLENFVKSIVENACGKTKNEDEEEKKVDYKKLYEDLKAKIDNEEEEEETVETEEDESENGGAGSGDFDHAGRPGMIGGSEKAGTGRGGKYDKKGEKNWTGKNPQSKLFKIKNEAENSIDDNIKEAILGGVSSQQSTYLTEADRIKIGEQY